MNRKNVFNRGSGILTLGVLALLLVGTALTGANAKANHVQCGDVLTRNTTLDSDLICPGGDGLIIGANGIQLDLGGHTLTGDPVTGIGIQIFGLRGVTIKNGTIEGFNFGVSAFQAGDLKLTHLSFYGQGDGPPFNANVLINDSRKVQIERSTFQGPSANDDGNTHPQAITVLGSSDVKVQNINAQGYVLAVFFGFKKITGGEISNNVFFNNGVNIQVSNTNNLKIAGNQISGCLDVPSPFDPSSCRGIELCGPVPFCPGETPQDAILSNLNIVNNYIQGSENSLGGNNFSNSSISGNKVHDGTFGGIYLHRNSTGNRISRNLTSGSGIDLQHDVTSTPNEWLNNSCETKDGADIPPCYQ